MKSSPCKVCRIVANYSRSDANISVNCSRCGEYDITDEFDQDFKSSLNESELSTISGWLRENNKILLTEDIICRLKVINITVQEKMQKLLQWINKKTQSPGANVSIPLETTNNNFLTLLAICWIYDLQELVYLINFLEQAGYIEKLGSTSIRVLITPRGFAYLDEVNKTVQSDLSFCAMWFDEELNPVWELAIEPAVRQAGYKAMRIDKHPHNEGVVDEILASIRRSKFLIADLTGNRGGVYYEAGFARGLGREVIFTCRKDFFEKEQTHFDVRHYNILLWDAAQYEDFKNRLVWRIEGTLGRGNN